MSADYGWFRRGIAFAPHRLGIGHGSHLDIGAVERAYRRYARIYDFLFGTILQPGRRAVVEHACSPGGRILEVGIGTGLSLPLYPNDVAVTGIDISHDMLVRALARKIRERLNNVVQLSLMDAEAMSFEDDCFDTVVAMHVASAVPHPERLVAEMCRVCKPNGRMFFVGHFRSHNIILGCIERLIAPLSRQLGFRPGFSLEAFLAETGLVTMSVRPVGKFGFCTMVEVRNNKRFTPRKLVSVPAAWRGRAG